MTSPVRTLSTIRGTIRAPRGAGDVIHAIAHPIAIAIDAATAIVGHPTHLRTCGGCARRRAQANAALPFGHRAPHAAPPPHPGEPPAA